RIVKAFNSVVTARFNEGPAKNGGRRVIFVSGDHPEPHSSNSSSRVSASRRSISVVSRRVAACSRPGVRSPVATSSNSAITNTGGAECVQCKSELSASREPSLNLPTFPNLQHRPPGHVARLNGLGLDHLEGEQRPRNPVGRRSARGAEHAT